MAEVTTSLNAPWRGAAYALSAGVLWSFIGLIVRQIEMADEWQILFYRSLAALPIVIGLMMLGPQPPPLRRLEAYKSIVAAAVCAAIATISMMIALHNTSVANTLLLISIAPLFASVIARITLKEQISARVVICVLLALSGVVVMVHDEITHGLALGELAALISAIGFALFTVLLRSRPQQNMLPALCLGDALTGTVAFFVIMGTNKTILIASQDLLLCLLLGGFFYGVGWVVYVAAAKWIPSTKMTLFALTEVVLGPLWVWLFIDETLQQATLIGGTIIITAIALQAIPDQRPKRYSVDTPLR